LIRVSLGLTFGESQEVNMNDFVADFLGASLLEFKKYKKYGDGAITQVSDAQLNFAPEPNSNSIAVIVKHLHGNMISRWQNLFGADGESANRNRDAEFEPENLSRASVLELWESGWACLFSALENLKPDDFSRSVLIRGEAHSVIAVIQRQLAHYPGHVGQIVYLAKMFQGEQFQSLSIKKGQSAAFNVAMLEKQPNLKP
jgi:Protein of unknown function (DUF1572)